MTFTRLLQTAQLLTDQVVLGHLHSADGRPSAAYLDAVSLALLWMTVTRLTVGRGLTSATNVLAAQAIGAGKPELAVEWLQLALLCALVASVPVAISWLLLDRMLPLLQEPAVVALATSYARVSVAWLVPALFFDCTSAWLAAQKRVLPQLCILAVGFAANLALDVLLVLHGEYAPGVALPSPCPFGPRSRGRSRLCGSGARHDDRQVVAAVWPRALSHLQPSLPRKCSRRRRRRQRQQRRRLL